ncbi:MAG: bifunctional phosphopantothenoylcysteine decarboxylase/phosphopantothenate--cysteine ligase CoaBC [Opitutaceae bacterium]
MSASRILFILSGSIACYKACAAISQLVQDGHRVRTVATTAALKFVGAATLEGLTRERVWTDLFEEGAALDHIALERWADVVVICPATAHTLNRMTAGLGDDLAGALLLAHDWAKPLVIAPAMNPAMWTHPATAASIERLQKWGARFVNIGNGRTACGEVGEGRLAEPDEIVAAIQSALSRPARRLRVLVTSGGTSEPVDGVRALTNSSTGATGALIADHLSRAGHEVVLLRATNAERARFQARDETFDTFASLDSALERLLGAEHFDAVIHAAAVSDFSVDGIEVDGKVCAPGVAKLGSEVAPTLRLRRNPKLLDFIRPRSRNPAVCVVAFKLTRGADAGEVRTAVRTLLERGAADLVVHNDLAARTSDGAFPAEIWSATGVVEKCASRAAIGAALEKLLATERAGATGGGGQVAPRKSSS